MDLESIKWKLNELSIYHSEEEIMNTKSVIGYEKKFKWSWAATQLNTFIVATDFHHQEINTSLIESHLAESFRFSKQHYKGWPRGLQSALGSISILISNNVTEKAHEYCRRLKSGEKWAAFTIPVVCNSDTKEVSQFDKNPIWGAIYYPHFKTLIDKLK